MCVCVCVCVCACASTRARVPRPFAGQHNGNCGAASPGAGTFRTSAANPFATARLARSRVGKRVQRPARRSGGTAQLSGSGGVELEECYWHASEAAPGQGARARG